MKYLICYYDGNEGRLRCVISTWSISRSATAAESALAATKAKLEAAEAVLVHVIEAIPCGCVPCTGQCMSRDSLMIHLDGLRDDARAALNTQGDTDGRE